MKSPVSVQKCQMQQPASNHIVYLDPKGKLIDRVNIPSRNSPNISLRNDTINCTEWKTNTIYCYTLTGQEIWTFKDENVLRGPRGLHRYLNKLS
jgi:outer membrane protein assembly factor BamB